MNTIADIDDAKLGRMMKTLLVKAEKDGGALNISRSNRQPFSFAAGIEQKDLPQHWTIQSSVYIPGVSFVNQQATLSHDDLGELLERLAVATR